jgi:hypothetical protein
MSMRFGTPVRDKTSVLKEAVLLALHTNSDIKTMDPISRWNSPEYYIICERASSQSLFNIELKRFQDIEFCEYTKNTQHRVYSIFYSLPCMQYPIDSIEDKQHIQDIANLILQFCAERMHIATVPLRKPEPSPFDYPHDRRQQYPY